MTITLPPEFEQLARQVAARSGRTPEDVLRSGLEREARMVGVTVLEPRAPADRPDSHRAREIARRIASRPLLDERPPTEILDEAWGGTDDRRR